jgi:hypothetical protein
MKYAVEIGSGAMICIPSFIKIVSTIQKLGGGGVHRHHGDPISLLLFFQNKEGRLIICIHKTPKESHAVLLVY